jgi:torulene dioxygenase
MLYVDHMRTVDPSGKSIDVPAARRFVLSGITPLSSSASQNSQSLPIREAKQEFSVSNIELPTIHPRAYSAPYRYAYGTHRGDHHVPGVFTDKIVKIDMKTRTWKTWGTDGYTTGEPIFVSRPRDDISGKMVSEAEEDDGVVLSVVLDGVRQRSMLVVLNAKDLTEVARAEMDRCMPLGFHGVFMERMDTDKARL